MTALELLRSAARRWYVTLVCVLATLGATYLAGPSVVYWGAVAVTVVQPADPTVPKTLEDTGSDPIAAAIMLMEMVNGGRVTVRPTSPEATLYGEGYRRNVVARLRDIGGQWASQIQEPVIDVQAVDTDANSVHAQLQEQTQLLDAQLEGLQDKLAVTEGQRMSLDITPSEVNVWEVTGSRVRAFGATLVVGISLTVTALYWIEILARRRSIHAAVPRHIGRHR